MFFKKLCYQKNYLKCCFWCCFIFFQSHSKRSSLTWSFPWTKNDHLEKSPVIMIRGVGRWKSEKRERSVRRCFIFLLICSCGERRSLAAKFDSHCVASAQHAHQALSKTGPIKAVPKISTRSGTAGNSNLTRHCFNHPLLSRGDLFFLRRRDDSALLIDRYSTTRLLLFSFSLYLKLQLIF